MDVQLLLEDGGQSAFSARASPLHWRCPQPIMKVAHWGYRYAALFYQKKRDNLFFMESRTFSTGS